MKKILFIFLLVLGGCMKQSIDKISTDEQDRILIYILDKYELKNMDSIKKMEVIEFEKNLSTQTWRVTVRINNLFLISIKEDNIGSELRSSNYSDDEFIIKKYSNKDNIDLNSLEIKYYGE